jgi:hypothetical protein
MPAMRPFHALPMSIALLAACARDGASPPRPPDLSGAWVDVASLPGSPLARCCFFDSTREGNPCPPDTLKLGADGSMRYTSLPDEPATFAATEDTFYYIRQSGDHRDTSRFTYRLRGDTLDFAIAPLCAHADLPGRYLKIH